MMMDAWKLNLFGIAAAIFLVVVNGFFVAAEFALVKVRIARLNHLVKERRPFARSALWLAKRLDRSLSACQLGITMASLGLGWVGEPVIARMLEPLLHAAGVTSAAVVHGLAFAIGFTAITAAHLVLGEQAPKIFAIRRPEEMAVWSALPMRAFYIVSYPLVSGLDIVTSAVLRTVGVHGATHDQVHTNDELRALASYARSHGEMSGTEHRLVEAAFEFEDKVCRQIMLSRSDVDFIDADAPVEDVIRIVHRTRHTRYPVREPAGDGVIGIVHVKDLVAISAKSIDMRSIVRPPKYVPETMSVSKLLGHFQSTRQHMAIVVDENGVLVGIVTLENVLEEIIGPVQDEFDAETPSIVPEGSRGFLVAGRTPIADASAALDLPLEAEGVDTMGGLMVVRLGRVPLQGDRVDLEGATAEVVGVQVPGPAPRSASSRGCCRRSRAVRPNPVASTAETDSIILPDRTACPPFPGLDSTPSRSLCPKAGTERPTALSPRGTGTTPRRTARRSPRRSCRPEPRRRRSVRGAPTGCSPDDCSEARPLGRSRHRSGASEADASGRSRQRRRSNLEAVASCAGATTG
jgi:CBS domain containing-hemolysin-like protein